MLIYSNKTKKSIYFVHIPRTGGRYVSKMFQNNYNFLTLFSEYNCYYNGKDIPHLTYPDYLNLKYPNYHQIKFDIKNIPHFTIVRDPFNRFKSSIKDFIVSEKDLSELLEYDTKTLKQKINHYIKYSSTNWFVPQFKFISSKTKIWKYENGFNKDFKKWIKINFDIDINIEKKVIYSQRTHDYEKVDLKSLEKIKPIIKEIYKEDYNKFFYE